MKKYVTTSTKDKVGILTLHSGYNEGGILQAFCLAVNLQNAMKNTTVEIVDHRYPLKMKAYGPARDDRKRALKQFIDETLPLSDETFLQNSNEAAFDYMRKHYKVIVTGSDELWKLKYTKRLFGIVSEQNDPWRPAFPNVYWPDESVRIPKIAYAVSIGQTDWSTIPKKHLRRMRRILSDYVLLGVRDQRTMSYLKWLDPDIRAKAEWVPDPTFSIDIMSLIDREKLKKKLQDWGVDFDRPRICVVLRETPKIHGDIINKIKNQDFQVISLSLPYSGADVDLSGKGFTPLEWFGVIGLMDFCISQRMHTCISCITHDTPFVAVDFYSNAMDDDTKVKDLMRSFNLLDYYYNVDKDSPEKFQAICEQMLNSPWPVHKTEQKKIDFNSCSREFTKKIKEIVSDR